MEECLLKLQDQPATILKVTLPYRCFSRFLNITNGTKSHKTSHLGIDVVAEESLLWPASSTNEDFMKLRLKKWYALWKLRYQIINRLNNFRVILPKLMKWSSFNQKY